MKVKYYRLLERIICPELIHWRIDNAIDVPDSKIISVDYMGTIGVSLHYEDRMYSIHSIRIDSSVRKSMGDIITTELVGDDDSPDNLPPVMTLPQGGRKGHSAPMLENQEGEIR